VLEKRHYLLVDGVGITSDGPVFSVFLAHRGAVRDVRRITIDRASVTSVNLLQVILAGFHHLRPELVPPGEGAERTDGLLLIGNQAIEFRHTHGETHQFFDLGEEWRRETGLPFVYAAWVILPSLPNASSVAEEFRFLKRDGVARLAEIVENGVIGSREFRRRYLTEHIRYDLGIREKAGLEKFRSLLVKHGLVLTGSAPLEYV
jgi:chorismate dehydratase